MNAILPPPPPLQNILWAKRGQGISSHDLVLPKYSGKDKTVYVANVVDIGMKLKQAATFKVTCYYILHSFIYNFISNGQWILFLK